MRSLTADELLTLWERGRSLSLLQRTILLLELATADSGKVDVASLSIGERDARLFRLREWMFGSLFRNTINCPACEDRMEWEMHLNELKMLPEDFNEPPKEHMLKTGPLSIRFRLPNSRDVSDFIAAENKVPDKLLEKCILEIRQNNDKKPPEKLPAKVMDQLISKMEELDPLADLRVQISCPNCQHQWEARFDIMHYLWDEIDHWAQRMLQDVYKLAGAFGWSEQEILRMDAGRRQLYIEMVNER